MRIAVIDHHGRGIVAADYWMPLYLNRRRLRQLGVHLRFVSAQQKLAIFAGKYDVLFLSSRAFFVKGNDDEERRAVLRTLEDLRGKGAKIVWFDMRDSAGNSQFEVLPFVDAYWKKQIYKDRSAYYRPLYGNRLYTDYYHREFGIEDSYSEDAALLSKEHEHKLGLAWNLGVTDFHARQLHRRLLDIALDHAGLRRSPRLVWTDPGETREHGLIALFRAQYERDTVAYQRRRALEILDEYRKSGTPAANAMFTQKQRVPRHKFTRLLGSAKIVLSLYGWGEVCYRDYETWLAGAALLMPDMSHLETVPDVYTARETYWPLQWDLSDLVSSYEMLMNDDDLRLDLARAGQDRYRNFWSEPEQQKFCEDLVSRLRGL